MSFCLHDPHCPGHGEAHDAAPNVYDQLQSITFTDSFPVARRATAAMPARGPSRDRSIPGKRRRAARKAARR